MSVAEMDKGRFITQISEAFAHCAYPEGKDYYAALAERDYKKYSEAHERKLSTEITENDLRMFYDFIFFLDPGGVIYYLPAYMNLHISNDQLLEYRSMESLLMAMANIKIEGLTHEQFDVCAGFLEFCRQKKSNGFEIDEALIDKAVVNFSNRPMESRGQARMALS